MSALQQSNSFSAQLALAAGVAVSITAPTLDDLQPVVAKLQPAANDTKTAAPAPKPTTVSTAKATEPAPTPTAAPASAPPASAGSAPGADEKRPTYDEVRDRILKLAKVSKDTAVAALTKFGVDAGPKLKLEQYPDFIAHADSILTPGAAGA
jgi:hypothetical protein